MSFVFPFLLGSLALVGIPVLIHLIMRQKPRTLPFPAFQFLLKRHRTNLRKLRLRHLLLLALRVLLIGAMGVALARPQIFHQGFSLSSDRPVAAVLVFDTSFSMEYRTSDNVTRLEEAKKRGLDLLDQLQEGSRVAILDTADTVQSGKGQWYQVMNQAKERIGTLKLKAANSPVSQRLEDGYRILADLGRDREDESVRHLSRVLFVFSDRTRGSWDMSRLAQLREASDQVPPTLVGLQQTPADIPNLVDLLGQLRQQIPPAAGEDYPEQALLDSLAQLKDLVPRLTPEDLPPDSDLGKVIDNVRRRSRELVDTLQGRKENVSEAAKEYQGQLLGGVQALLRNLAGAQAFFMDVGVDQPTDLAILDLVLPPQHSGEQRQIFGEDEKIVVRALVQATGKDVSTMLRLSVGQKSFQKSLDLKAGQQQTVPFELDVQDLKLGPGQHSAELQVETKDQLNSNNSRFVTFAIREPRRVLVLADDPKKAEPFEFALRGARFTPEVVPPAVWLKTPNLERYQAVYLFGVQEPSEQLWNVLEDYFARGGGIGVVPGGEEMKADAYNQKAAQKILPGLLKGVQVTQPMPWNLEQDSIFQHSLLQPFRDWRNNKNIDFIVQPRVVSKFWEVQPQGREMVLVSYADKDDPPALLERIASKQYRAGKVLLFTTPLDGRKEWNNYMESLTSFYVVLTTLTTRYLAGDTEAVQLNFISGQAEPVVPLPLLARHPGYLLRGPEVFEQVAPPEGANELHFKQAVQPGNYSVDSVPAGSNKVMARFSVNVPPEESDLGRVPVMDVEAALGAGSVLPAHRQANIQDLMKDHWREPVELFPPLMVLLLLVLAVENLLANKFYRQENEPAGV